MSRNKGAVKAKRQRTHREKLTLFLSKAGELQNTRLMTKISPIRRSVSDQDELPIEFSLGQPEEAELKDYLMTFRHFIADKEDTSLSSIFSICYQSLTSEEEKQNIALVRQSFEKIKKCNGTLIIVNGKEYTSLEIKDMYLNGQYFHNDLEYQEQLGNMPPFIYTIMRFTFLNFVIDTSRIIMDVQQIVDHAFKENLFQFEKTE